MGPKIAIAAACLLVLAVGVVRKPTRDTRLVGRWSLDAGLALHAADEATPTPGRTEGAALRAILAQARIEVEFTEDRMHLSTSLPGHERSRDGRYRITRVEGNKIFLEFESDGAWEQETLELYGTTLWIETEGLRVGLRRRA